MAELIKKKILVFASGGGSGFEELVKASQKGILDAEIVGVVSNKIDSGAHDRAMKLNIPFCHFPSPWTAERYQQVVTSFEPDLVALSGWLKKVAGLDPARTINIHPGPLPMTAGLYGHLVHERVMELFHEGKLKYSAVTMHFVTEEYDAGPIFFVHKVKIEPDDTPETLAQRVNKVEHIWQPLVTQGVVHDLIRWDGSNLNTLVIESPWRTPETEF